MALDEARGVVYVPTGSAASDFYGADRLGDNLFANSLVALDASTGKRLWHFQFVRHDVWDRDLPSPPSLMTLRQNGRTIEAVAQSTKHGYVFVFDRTNGQPVFPIEYRPFPSSTVPGEVTHATQPIPTKPAPFARQLLTENLLSARTPAIRDWALNEFKTFHSAGQFVPLSVNRQTVVFPGFDGGAEWGGQAFDPDSGLYYVNANDLAWTGGLAPNTGGQSGQALYLQHCATCHRDDRVGAPPSIPTLIGIGDRKTFAEITTVVRQGAGRMPGFPALDQAAVNAIVQFTLTGADEPPPGAGRGRGGAAPPAPASPLINNSFRFTGYRRFMDPDGFPATAPPWGTLSAINLNTGDYAWQVPLGEYPELVAQGLRNTGSENYGGPVVTAGGLVFIGATNADRKLRAFDKSTGTLLWETVMAGPGRATPADVRSQRPAVRRDRDGQFRRRARRSAGRGRRSGDSDLHRVCVAALGQRLSTVLDAFRDLRHPVGAGGHVVLELDRGLNVPLVVADQLEHFGDRRVARAERHVRAVVQLPILHVHVRDARVVFLEERNRRAVAAGDEVADVEVGAVVRGVAECFLPVSRTRSRRGRDSRPSAGACRRTGRRVSCRRRRSRRRSRARRGSSRG